MRVDSDIAMTGKMFRTGHDTFVLHPFHILNTEFRYLDLILPERTIVDHRVIRIVIDVHYRSIVYLDANPPALRTYKMPILIDKRGISRRTQHHLTRQPPDTVHTHSKSILCVDTKKDGSTRQTLIIVDMAGLCKRVALEQANTPYIVFPHGLLYLLVIKY